MRTITLLLMGTSLIAIGWASTRTASAYVPLPAARSILEQIGLTAWLSYDQQQAATTIANTARKYGGSYWIPLAQALIANAKAESNLDPRAIGDGGASYGLFQLHTKAGAGADAIKAGWSAASLLTSEANAEYFIGQVVMRVVPMSLDADELTRQICIRAERPTDALRKAEERVRIRRSMFA
jgi:hypothetical protein